MNTTPLTVEEILSAAQTLTVEERKRLIQELLAQMPRTGSLAGTIIEVNDFEAGKRELRQMVEESLERTARELNDSTR
jgi:hypothetical protein